MNFGYFDEENREYVITKPNTPAPWCNYLGSPEYGAIISNNAGGYSFVKSGANGRILRYHFNSDDTPGRYIYLRDDENVITGQLHGSRLEKTSMSTRARFTTERLIQRCSLSMQVSSQKLCIMYLLIKYMKYGV